jgi:predicted extracellular nuclease
VFATPWRRLGVSLLTLCLAIGALPLGAMSAAAVSPNVVISQVYGGGGNAGATHNADFVELFNRGTTEITMTGWSIQYASATGAGNFGTSTQITELPTLTLAAGQYVLIKESSGVNGAEYTADHTDPTPILMAAGAGKVALVTGTASLGCNGGSAPCDASQRARIVDLVGYGTGTSGANFYEGTGAAPTLSASLSASRAGAGCTDTDNNSADFTAGTPAPRDMATTKSPCESVPADGAPSVTSSSPSRGAAGVARDANVTITFSEPVNVTGPWHSISCVASGAHAATVSGGPTTFTLDPAADFAPNENCTVTVTGAQVSDQDTADPPDTMAADHAFTFTTIDDSVCGDPATFIHQVQGSGAATPMAGQRRTVEGVVVGDYQGAGQFSGYHVQEEDSDRDTDAATSEGIFVFNTAIPVNVGDVVRVTGTVSEFLSSGTTLTQIGSVTRALICPAGGTVTPTDVDLPVAAISDLERYESMLVSIDQRLTVTETFGLGRFGEVVLSSAGRLDTPTAVVEPGAPAQALQALNDRSRIVLDDGINAQNVDPTQYPQGGLSASNTLRVGDTLAALSGVLEQRFGPYRIQPVGAIAFDHDNTRPAAAPAVGGSAQVAAMNVLNYFTTLDPTPPAAGPFICGPTGGLECRGANTTFEFDRQRAKIIAALVGLDADIVGLMEIENNESAAVADLVAGLNEALGAGTYAYIDTGTIGTDAIKVAIIYKPAAATPVGAHAILDSTVDPRFVDTRSRPALAQTFDVAGGGRFTVVVNHLKSKGSACGADDPDTGDGSGNCNLTRTQAARALVDWLASDPTASGDRDVLVIGDLNAYAKEDPIDVFIAAGYTDLIDRFQDGAYSYVFQGQSGYLDHALASPTLAAQVTGANEWHVNADEPTALDYNTDFKSAGHVTTLYAPDAYRSSDHDPLLVGLELLDRNVAPVGATESQARHAGSTIVFTYDGPRATSEALFFDGPTSRPIDCVSGAPSGPAQPATLTSNDDENTFRWKTLKAWSESCRQLEVPLDDGTTFVVRVDFR